MKFLANGLRWMAFRRASSLRLHDRDIFRRRRPRCASPGRGALFRLGPTTQAFQPPTSPPDSSLAFVGIPPQPAPWAQPARSPNPHTIPGPSHRLPRQAPRLERLTWRHLGFPSSLVSVEQEGTDEHTRTPLTRWPGAAGSRQRRIAGLVMSVCMVALGRANTSQ